MALDVVCKMEIDEKTAEWNSEYKGKTYYFCSRGCKESFDAAPDRFLKPS